MGRMKDGALTPNQHALLRAIAFDSVTVGEAMRVAGYASRAPARKALLKLKNMGLIDGYFGEAGNVSPASFSITKAGRAALSEKGEKADGM